MTLDSLLESLKNLGPGRLIMMLATFFGLIIFFVFIAVRSSAPSLSLLYSDLSTADATEISAKLDNSNVPYALSEDGTKVSVPHKDIAKARMLLAAEGLPRKGAMGNELFDQKQTFGKTSFEMNNTAKRALEGELARTIATMDQVRSAKVMIVFAQRELFSKDVGEATASVVLNLRNVGNIGNEQIMAIRQLVASSVPKLKRGKVAVTDQSGNLLARADDEMGRDALSRNADDMRKSYETRTKQSIEDIVGRVVGFEKVRAAVTAKMNFDVLNRNSESYNPDGQVVRSTQSVTEEATDTSASSNGNGAVTVANNLPGLPAGSDAAQAGSKNNRTEETTNYEITKTVETLVREGGEIEKLSISVLVDGSYAPDTAAAKPKDAPSDWAAPMKYTPRSVDELTKIASLVKSAVGYDESRGDTVEVVNMQFAQSELFDATPVANDTILGFPKSDILGMAETLALSLVAILVILLVLRPLAIHFAAAARAPRAAGDGGADTPMLAGGPQQAQLAGPGGGAGMISGPSELESMIDMSSVEGKVKASSVQKISDLVTNHPNETVSVIRQWMSQEN